MENFEFVICGHCSYFESTDEDGHTGKPYGCCCLDDSVVCAKDNGCYAFDAIPIYVDTIYF